jgi:hypothetical protein
MHAEGDVRRTSTRNGLHRAVTLRRSSSAATLSSSRPTAATLAASASAASCAAVSTRPSAATLSASASAASCGTKCAPAAAASHTYPAAGSRHGGLPTHVRTLPKHPGAPAALREAPRLSMLESRAQLWLAPRKGRPMQAWRAHPAAQPDAVPLRPSPHIHMMAATQQQHQQPMRSVAQMAKPPAEPWGPWAEREREIALVAVLQ